MTGLTQFPPFLAALARFDRLAADLGTADWTFVGEWAPTLSVRNNGLAAQANGDDNNETRGGAAGDNGGLGGTGGESGDSGDPSVQSESEGVKDTAEGPDDGAVAPADTGADADEAVVGEVGDLLGPGTGGRVVEREEIPLREWEDTLSVGGAPPVVGGAVRSGGRGEGLLQGGRVIDGAAAGMGGVPFGKVYTDGLGIAVKGKVREPEEKKVVAPARKRVRSEVEVEAPRKRAPVPEGLVKVRPLSLSLGGR